MKKLNIGILAHVDAGKTTLSEGLLYTSGALRQKGRVDHKDAFLDYDIQERARGITIYAKQAIFSWDALEVTLIDTPGHVDFSSEMERTLQMLDYAILVISANDGLQAHTLTIWRLLQTYQIPLFIFINKMDLAHQEQGCVLQKLQQQLNIPCVDFTQAKAELQEAVAMCQDDLLDIYLQHTELSDERIANSIALRQLVPCYFGSALKLEGIQELLSGLLSYTLQPHYPQEFGAAVYKVSHDAQGNRLVHMKITGGSLAVKSRLTPEDKVDQIRRYHGEKFELLHLAKAGEVVALKGCKTLQAGDVLGAQIPLIQAQLNSFMEYRLGCEDCDTHTLLQYCKLLTEEDPQFHAQYRAQLDELHIRLMGEVQTEIYQQLFQERFHVSVHFDQGSVIYKETIKNTVEGIGHFEPLRHYAEVHLLLEPAKPNSGLQFHTTCTPDELPAQWQKLILTHLQEKEHLGVLTGSPITDMHITLLTGKAHEKHTEGGDFRQATYRAVRQGLMQAESQLLEPYYEFQLDVPNEFISKAMYDIETMNGSCQLVEAVDGQSTLIGEASAAKLQHYQMEVTSYTKGTGRLSCTFKGYAPCLEQEAVIDSIAYESERDQENPAGSIFCKQGAGFNVAWDQVVNHMHVHSRWQRQQEKLHAPTTAMERTKIDENLEQIYIRTYGQIRKRAFQKTPKASTIAVQPDYQPKPDCLLIDGYNMIHAWPKLAQLAMTHLDSARAQLIDALCSYQGYKQCLMIVVFDAYQIDSGISKLQQQDNFYIVYTKHAQTADMYIERATHELASVYQVTVATSDGMEQLITMGQGARRMSSRQLMLDMESTHRQESEEYVRKQKQHRTYLLEDIRDYQDAEEEEKR